MVESSDKMWSTGEGNGYIHQYSGLENSKERGAWQAKVHGVARRGTATPVHRPQRPAGSTHSSTRGLHPVGYASSRVEAKDSTILSCPDA